MHRLNEIVVMVEDSLRLFSEGRKKELGHKLSVATELFAEFGTMLPDEVAREKFRELEKAIQEQLKRYDLMILNWGLVMMWTAFEAEFEDLLLLLFRKNEKAFLQWGADLAISFKSLTECKDLDVAKANLYSKALRDFSNLGIRERIETLKRKLNLRDEELFNFAFSNEKIRKLLAGWGTTPLSEFQKTATQSSTTINCPSHRLTKFSLRRKCLYGS
jgi:hypothetical protein